ncbi:uncharacterized protein LOC134181932 [Corticium candelabrum]|uniref:uncharacterized protein LOC134181932 n=1 Tax=Corticium candelabrum TaxID=121492 RepID=UPI002E26F72E|nr:uncharacterized protein LOC134181932 [Corticium candelabrum]
MLSRRLLSLFSKRLEAEKASSNPAIKKWKAISLFVGVPVCSYLFYKHVIVSEEREHEKELAAWPHLRIRNKPFPWGDGNTTLLASAASVEHKEMGARHPKVHWITQWWWDNLTENFETREERRNAHVGTMQQRANKYLESKKNGRLDRLHDLMHADLSQLEVRSKNEEHGVNGY